jgi:beta-galactosidase
VFKLDAALLKAGNNTIAIVATPLVKIQSWDLVNMNPGLIQVIKPAAQWQRKLFSGLAQVIVQSTGEPGEILLKANSINLKPATIILQATAAKLRPSAN